MSLNEAYRLSVQNNTLECIYVDVKNHTVKTIWSKELPKNGNSIVGNQFGQLSILDENDNILKTHKLDNTRILLGVITIPDKNLYIYEIQ